MPKRSFEENPLEELEQSPEPEKKRKANLMEIGLAGIIRSTVGLANQRAAEIQKMPAKSRNAELKKEIDTLVLQEDRIARAMLDEKSNLEYLKANAGSARKIEDSQKNFREQEKLQKELENALTKLRGMMMKSESAMRTKGLAEAESTLRTEALPETTIKTQALREGDDQEPTQRFSALQEFPADETEATRRNVALSEETQEPKTQRQEKLKGTNIVLPPRFSSPSPAPKRSAAPSAYRMAPAPAKKAKAEPVVVQPEPLAEEPPKRVVQELPTVPKAPKRAPLPERKPAPKPEPISREALLNEPPIELAEEKPRNVREMKTVAPRQESQKISPLERGQIESEIKELEQEKDQIMAEFAESYARVQNPNGGTGSEIAFEKEEEARLENQKKNAWFFPGLRFNGKIKAVKQRIADLEIKQAQYTAEAMAIKAKRDPILKKMKELQAKLDAAG